MWTLELLHNDPACSRGTVLSAEACKRMVQQGGTIAAVGLAGELENCTAQPGPDLSLEMADALLLVASATSP